MHEGLHIIELYNGLSFCNLHRSQFLYCSYIVLVPQWYFFIKLQQMYKKKLGTWGPHFAMGPYFHMTPRCSAWSGPVTNWLSSPAAAWPVTHTSTRQHKSSFKVLWDIIYHWWYAGTQLWALLFALFFLLYNSFLGFSGETLEEPDLTLVPFPATCVT